MAYPENIATEERQRWEAIYAKKRKETAEKKAARKAAQEERMRVYVEQLRLAEQQRLMNEQVNDVDFDS